MKINREKLRASYRGVPCFFNELTNEITTKNKFYGYVIGILIFWDLRILGKEDFPFWVETEKKE